MNYQGYGSTSKKAEQQRALAQSLMPQNLGAPVNGIGGGLTQLAQALMSKRASKKADKYDAEHRAQMAAALQGATANLSPDQQAFAQAFPDLFSKQQAANLFPDQLKQQQLQQQQANTAFNQNLATRRADRADRAFDYRLQRDIAGDKIRNENIQYERGRDATADQFRADQFAYNQEQDAAKQDFRQQQLQTNQNQFAQNLDFKQQQLDASTAAAAEKAGAISPALQYKMDKDAAAAASDASAASLAKKGVLGHIERLREGGDLAGGFQSGFGGTRLNPFTKAPGSQRNDAKGVLNQVIQNLTLDKISNFKGAISDKDLEVAQGAATRLANPSISDREAKIALDELYTAFGGATQQTQQQDFSQMSLEELQRIAGGG